LHPIKNPAYSALSFKKVGYTPLSLSHRRTEFKLPRAFAIMGVTGFNSLLSEDQVTEEAPNEYSNTNSYQGTNKSDHFSLFRHTKTPMF
jgi:hypothetical protein